MLRASSTQKNIYLTMTALMLGAFVVSVGPELWKIISSGRSTLGAVNHVPLELYEYRFELLKEQRLIAAYREQFGPNYKKLLSYLGKSENVEQEAQDHLITTKLLVHMAQKAHVDHLSEVYIKREFSQPRTLLNLFGEGIPSSYLFTEQGMLKLDVLQSILRHMGINMLQLEHIVQQVLSGQFAAKLAYNATIVSKNGRALFDTVHFGDRTFEVKILPLGDILKGEHKDSVSKDSVSDEEIENFYKKYAESHKYWTTERRSGKFWEFDLKEFVERLDKEANRDRTSKETEQKRAQEPSERFTGAVQQLLLLGDDKAFNQFVDNFRGKSGSLSKIAKDLDDPLIEALFSTLKGEKRVAIKGNKGYIVEFTDSVAPQKLPLESVAQRIRQDIYRERAEKRALDKVSQAAPFQVTIPAQSPTDPEVLMRHKLSRSLFDGLLIPQQVKEGISGDVAYHITLVSTSIDKEREKASGNASARLQKSYDQEAEILLRELIASLRNNAIINIQA